MSTLAQLSTPNGPAYVDPARVVCIRPFTRQEFPEETGSQIVLASGTTLTVLGGPETAAAVLDNARLTALPVTSLTAEFGAADPFAATSSAYGETQLRLLTAKAALAEAELAERLGTHPRTTGEGPWLWWASDDGESFTVGPCRTRGEVIAEARAAGFHQTGRDGGGTASTFTITEARQDPIDLARFFDADQAVSEMLNSIDVEHAGPDIGSLTGGEQWGARVKDLQDTLTAAVSAWQARFRIALTPWKFSATRNAEEIKPEDAAGFRLDLSRIEAELHPATRALLDRTGGFPSHPRIDALSGEAIVRLKTGLRTGPAELRARYAQAVHALITGDLSAVDFATLDLLQPEAF